MAVAFIPSGRMHPHMHSPRTGTESSPYTAGTFHRPANCGHSSRR